MAPEDERPTEKDNASGPPSSDETEPAKKEKDSRLSVLTLALPVAAVVILTLTIANWQALAQWLGGSSCPTCGSSAGTTAPNPILGGGRTPTTRANTATTSTATTLISTAQNEEPAYITVEELKTKMDNKEDVHVFDVRSKSAYDTEHITGAKSIPLAEVPDRYKEVPREGEVVLYCSCPTHTAIMAYRTLAQHDYDNAKVLKEGLGGWRTEGYPVESGLP